MKNWRNWNSEMKNGKKSNEEDDQYVFVIFVFFSRRHCYNYFLILFAFVIAFSKFSAYEFIILNSPFIPECSLRTIKIRMNQNMNEINLYFSYCIHSFLSTSQNVSNTRKQIKFIVIAFHVRSSLNRTIPNWRKQQCPIPWKSLSNFSAANCVFLLRKVCRKIYTHTDTH